MEASERKARSRQGLRAEGWTQVAHQTPETMAAAFRARAKETGPQGVKICGTSAIGIWDSLPSPVRREIYRYVWSATVHEPNDLTALDVGREAVKYLEDYKHHLRQLVLGEATNPRTVWRVDSAEAIDWSDGGPWLWELKNDLEKLKKSRKGKG